LSAATPSTPSPSITEAFQVVSVSDRDATCFGISLIRSVYSPPDRCGQAWAKAS
jgi:hypothetical protein